MNARQHRKLSEEMELQQKNAELASLRARHAEARVAWQRLRDEVARFEELYHQALGSRIAELERLEAEIARRGSHAHRERPSERAAGYREREERAASSAAAETEPAPAEGAGAEPRNLKALYREVAKAIHPDLGGRGPAENIRHELMAKANRAYAEDDRRTLQEILRNWRRCPDQAEGDEAGPELALAIRRIARERQEIRALNAKVEELKASYVWRFKKRVEANLALGVDVLADMVADTDLEIVRALRRLAALKVERPQEPAGKRRLPGKKLTFPAGMRCAAVYLRDRSSLSYSNWKRVGVADGRLEVAADQAVRLDLQAQGRDPLGHLRQFAPDDLQALFLYDIDDGDLENLVHLTGLEELCLSGVRLTDAGLRHLAALRNLKRVYLYQTQISDQGLGQLLHLPGLLALTSSGNAITEEGLAAFRLAAGGVKTTSFKWKK